MKLELYIVVIGIVFIALMYFMARVVDETAHATRKQRRREAWLMVVLTIALFFLLGTLF